LIEFRRRKRREAEELLNNSYGFVKVSQYDTFAPERFQTEEKGNNVTLVAH